MIDCTNGELTATGLFQTNKQDICLVYWFEKGLCPKAHRFVQYIIIFPVLYVEEKVYFALYHFKIVHYLTHASPILGAEPLTPEDRGLGRFDFP